ncbi:MAG: hypothetical protein HRT44_09815 [Bdellovibrionales bacterium]|nr:hypothetical protein [Bdellovibrionales bacterium]
MEASLKPLLSEEEYQKVMGSPNKASAVLALQSKHLSALKNDKKVWEFSYLQIEDLIKEFYTLQGKSERIKNFPYPRQYFTLGVHLTWAFILLLPYAMIPEFTRIGEVISKTTAISPDLFTFYFFLYSICGLCIMDISHNGANGTCW